MVATATPGMTVKRQKILILVADGLLIRDVLAYADNGRNGNGRLAIWALSLSVHSIP
jgi:hypothetical protein